MGCTDGPLGLSNPDKPDTPSNKPCPPQTPLRSAGRFPREEREEAPSLWAWLLSRFWGGSGQQQHREEEKQKRRQQQLRRQQQQQQQRKWRQQQRVTGGRAKRGTNQKDDDDNDGGGSGGAFLPAAPQSYRINKWTYVRTLLFEAWGQMRTAFRYSSSWHENTICSSDF